MWGLLFMYGSFSEIRLIGGMRFITLWKPSLLTGAQIVLQCLLVRIFFQVKSGFSVQSMTKKFL